MITIETGPIDGDALRRALADPSCGGFCTFEGWVRNENEGHAVLRLEYEAYEPLALTEGASIIEEARRLHPFRHARIAHRTGMLEIGECAVWVGVVAPHRDEAFRACRYVIDELKVRLPIWKKEYYANGDSGWVNCERCKSHAEASRELEVGSLTRTP